VEIAKAYAFLHSFCGFLSFLWVWIFPFRVTGADFLDKLASAMIQEIAYAGWKRNVRLQGPTTELIITLDVGPRILRYAFPGEKNVFVEIPKQLGGAGEKDWQIRGGHRFWTAPEGGHSYAADNEPVTCQRLSDTAVEIVQPAHAGFKFQKTLRVELLPGEVVRVTHLLTNAGATSLDLSPWALSVMAPGGVALIPQPELGAHPSEWPAGSTVNVEEDYLPNRELVLWPFTNLADGRYTFSKHFLRLAWRPELSATKLGMKLPTGWVAYQNGESVFAKHFTYDPAQPYPDRGVNFEIFTNPDILELESLAPSTMLAPGASSTHVEHWVLRKSSADLRDEQAAKAFFAALPKIG